ncbi:MAG: alpha-galactosidase, partial [Clostridia bacterium]|nr:alpha-galactosidase [Clostridia bacterium]
MSINYSDEFKSFYLNTPNTSYVFHINDGGFLVHDYYGKKIPECDLRYYSARPGRSSFSPRSADGTTTPDSAPMEYSVNGTGDYRA